MANLNDNCLKCKDCVNYVTEKCLRCSGSCRGVLHRKCSDYTPEEFNLIEGSKNLKWLCDACINSETKHEMSFISEMEQSEPRAVYDAKKIIYANKTSGLETNQDFPATIILKSTADVYDTKASYVEPNDLYPNKLEYPRNGNDQGIVVIFNQVYFDHEETRLGSNTDVENIILTLGRLGYNIDSDYIFSSFTTEQIQNKLQEIRNEDLSKRNSLILFFLSHGSYEGALSTKNGKIKAQDIWNQLGTHKDLNEKPKLFVFQACAGSCLSTPSKSANKDDEHKITSLSFASSLPADVLLFFASSEGMKSYRHEIKGSWLVQEIYRNFLTYGRRDDTFTLLTRIVKCISIYEHHNTKQMPVIASTLTKKFYLTKRKERINLLAHIELYNKMIQHLNQLKSLIEKKNRECLHLKTTA